MKGFVPTPDHLVDRMVEELFAGRPPREGSRLLDPGCGTGAFIAGLLRWGQRTGRRLPHLVGVDSDAALLRRASEQFGSVPGVTLEIRDFLGERWDSFDYIVGNPPYVSITGLSVEERDAYRKTFVTAVGRFDLYSLFFEQALRLLKPGGRLVFVTPEKFAYVESASRLRQMLASAGVRQIEFVDEATFPGLTTYPVVTTVDTSAVRGVTRVIPRSGQAVDVQLPAGGESWLPRFNPPRTPDTGHVLAEACVRISCGVATGADPVFVLKDEAVPASLRPFAHPTVSGRHLNPDAAIETSYRMLVPYTDTGDLLAEDRLGALGAFLRAPGNYMRLLGRTCVARKPWYAFHETPPLADILSPKILCKDIAATPKFFMDLTGKIVPRHSVYYLVPAEPERVPEICSYLNSTEVTEFLLANCQRAANGFVRLQSHVLKRIPIPKHLMPVMQFACT